MNKTYLSVSYKLYLSYVLARMQPKNIQLDTYYKKYL